MSIWHANNCTCFELTYHDQVYPCDQSSGLWSPRIVATDLQTSCNSCWKWERCLLTGPSTSSFKLSSRSRWYYFVFVNKWFNCCFQIIKDNLTGNADDEVMSFSSNDPGFHELFWIYMRFCSNDPDFYELIEKLYGLTQTTQLFMKSLFSSLRYTGSVSDVSFGHKSFRVDHCANYTMLKL